MALAHAPAVQNHFIARFKALAVAAHYFAGKVNTGHHRKIADNQSFTGNRQRIFIVEGGIAYPHGHFAGGQIGFVQIAAKLGAVIGIFVDAYAFKHGFSLRDKSNNTAGKYINKSDYAFNTISVFLPPAKALLRYATFIKTAF